MDFLRKISRFFVGFPIFFGKFCPMFYIIYYENSEKSNFVCSPWLEKDDGGKNENIALRFFFSNLPDRCKNWTIFRNFHGFLDKFSCLTLAGSVFYVFFYVFPKFCEILKFLKDFFLFFCYFREFSRSFRNFAEFLIDFHHFFAIFGRIFRNFYIFLDKFTGLAAAESVFCQVFSTFRIFLHFFSF